LSYKNPVGIKLCCHFYFISPSPSPILLLYTSYIL
jgi:hypothetical protein